MGKDIRTVEIQIPIASETFNLEKAVCSHGLFMMPPNRWDPLSQTFSRPLRLSQHTLVSVSISQPKPTTLSLHVTLAAGSFGSEQREFLLNQVVRMLRLSPKDHTNLEQFQKVIGGDEGGLDFSGRVFRSPTLFEDMVKCILLCNCQFSRTLSMAIALCQLPKVQSDHSSLDYFPSPEELAILDQRLLAKMCNLGYRTSRIIKLSRAVVDGRINLREIEEEASSGAYDKVAYRLRQIDGFGPFTCANVLMCLGFYHVVPTDSETIRHIKQFHGKKSTIQTAQRDLEEIYGKYAPFQFLVYWGELWNFYNKKFGNLSEIPCSNYKLITASNMKGKDQTRARE